LEEEQMKKRIIAALAITLLLVATLSLPAVALDEQSVTAAVIVDGYISITLSGSISFGQIEPPANEVKASGQSEGNPAITITVASETNVNVDIGIKGTLNSGSLALEYWKYSKDFAKTGITGLTDSYELVYANVGANSVNPFYHWITVPDGTASGMHTITVNYKAVETGTSF
jgi:spore coat protein U-like protein